MPADFQSTARALEVSVSPLGEPESPLFFGVRPPWSQPNIAGRRSSLSLSGSEAISIRDRAINFAQMIRRRVSQRWDKLTRWQKMLTLLFAILFIGLGTGIMILTGKVFIWIRPMADKWEHEILPYVVVFLCIIVVSFPPLVGWTTLGTISGLIFGFWKGWLVFVTASVVGSTCSLIVSRSVLSGLVHRLLENDKRFAAFALTLKYDGLKLLCMIRLCPLPYSLCNGAMSTFPAVTPLHYAMATAAIAPKMMIAAFIGSRIRSLSGDEEKGAGARLLDVMSILFSVSLAAFTGWYIYRRTLIRAKELEAEERANNRQSLQGDHEAGRRHGALAHDPESNTTTATLARDQHDRLHYQDGIDDNVDIAIDDLDDDRSPSRTKYSNSNNKNTYRDEFTDNESDIFRDGDDVEGEQFGLHSRVQH